MPGLHILISGAGIAGPTLALLLSRSGQKHDITIVERSPTLRTTGQQVDLRLSGITVMRRLGLLDELKAITTEETGLAFVNADDKVKAAIPVKKDEGSQSFSSEFEILRGKFAELMYEKTKDLPETRYIFDERIDVIEQKNKQVFVKFKNGTPSAWFDLVVAADGLHSRTRAIAWAQATPTESSTLARPEESPSTYKSLNQYMAFFSLPIADSDLRTAGTGMARWYNAPGRRFIMVRPDHKGKKQSSANLGIVVPPSRSGRPESRPSSEKVSNSTHRSTRQRLDVAIRNHADVPSQKALFRELFADAGWEVDRVLRAMDKSEDFYLQEIAQVKLSPAAEAPHRTWSRGHVVCVGDAGYCPTLITGMGTTIAIMGTYVLAGEIVRAAASTNTAAVNEDQSSVDHDAIDTALAKYEQLLRPYVEKAQKVIPGAPGIICPQTGWGISILHGILGLVTKTGLATLGSKLSTAFGKETFELPQYKELCLID